MPNHTLTDENAVVLMPLDPPPQPTGGAAPAGRPALRGRWAQALTYAAYTATTFLSAALLFSVQPMFAKLVLPKLGGAPSVWAVALLFFQGALLAGYLYAHLLMRSLPARGTGLVHLLLVALAAFALPIALPEGVGDPPAGDPTLWQLEVFTLAVGLPFLAVAANAPLLQAWFADTGHPAGRDPYFMYAASNLGSLLALLAYPLLLEPALGLQALFELWALLFYGLLGALALCYALLLLSPAPRPARPEAGGPIAPSVFEPMPAGMPRLASRRRPRTVDRWTWVGLAFVPAALLTAITTHISTDVASAPLIWVVPLSLYLLTFVLVFRERPLLPWPLLLGAHVLAVLATLLLMAQTRNPGWVLSSAAAAAAFLTSALVAHRALYEARPTAQYLTEFYLWMSTGGVLGGLFAALLAPQLFSEVFEYPLLLALSFACRPDALPSWLGAPRAASLREESARESSRSVTALLALAGLVLLWWAPWAAGKLGWTGTTVFGTEWGLTACLAALFGAAVLASWGNPERLLVAALLMMLAVVTLPSNVHRGEAQRSYFGVYRVALSEDGDYNILTHGTTLHGAQRIRDIGGEQVVETAPVTYYHPGSPMAQAVRIVRATREVDGRKARIGVVGLGAGSLACLSDAGEAWRFFEIDPVVVGIARDSGHFTYMRNCQPDAPIVLGDARLTLAREPDGQLDLLIVDAFTSDAVPVHLMTAEALTLYAAKLAPDGIAVLHISNRYLDLEQVLAATVPQVPGLQGVVVNDDTADGSYGATASTVVVVSRSQAALAPFDDSPGVANLPAAKLRAWTDDYSDILGPLQSRLAVR